MTEAYDGAIFVVSVASLHDLLSKDRVSFNLFRIRSARKPFLNFAYFHAGLETFVVKR